MIRAIIFDVGGVLLRTEDRSYRNELEQRLHLRPGESEFLVFNSEMGQAAQLGKVTPEELWRWLQRHLGLSDEGVVDFQRQFWAGDRMDVELVDFVRRLRSRYITAIISNAQGNLPALLTDTYPMADAFDLIVYSAAEGVMKPDPAIFLRTLERLDCAAHEAVFIDDFAHNVEGARAVGMSAIHYRAGMDVRAALGDLGVKGEE
jgi:epoxide hydrolase-like predicted phosphatase